MYSSMYVPSRYPREKASADKDAVEALLVEYYMTSFSKKPIYSTVTLAPFTREALTHREQESMQGLRK